MEGSQPTPIRVLACDAQGNREAERVRRTGMDPIHLAFAKKKPEARYVPINKALPFHRTFRTSTQQHQYTPTCLPGQKILVESAFPHDNQCSFRFASGSTCRSYRDNASWWGARA